MTAEPELVCQPRLMALVASGAWPGCKVGQLVVTNGRVGWYREAFQLRVEQARPAAPTLERTAFRFELRRNQSIFGHAQLAELCGDPDTEALWMAEALHLLHDFYQLPGGDWRAAARAWRMERALGERVLVAEVWRGGGGGGGGAGQWVEARLPYRLGDQLTTNAASQLVLVATAAAAHRPAVATSRGATINALPSHISARVTVGMDAGAPGSFRASAAPTATVARFTAELRQWVDERERTTAGGSFCLAELLVGQAGTRWAAVSRDCALQAVKALTAEVLGRSYSAHAHTRKCAEQVP